jgi:hypothetical protein
MKYQHKRGWIVGGVGLIFGISLIASHWGPRSTQAEEPLPGLMLAKLASTQRVVSGLVSKNFSEIKRGAEDMQRICDASQWQTHPDPIYGHHRTELKRQAVKLARVAEDQNLDGSAFIYMQTMSTCISCHEHCRDVLRIAESTPPKGRVIPIPAAEEEIGWSSMPTLRR